MSFLKSIAIVAIAATVVLASCEKEPQYHYNDIIENVEYHDDATSNLSVFFLDRTSCPDYLFSALSKRFPTIASNPNEARVLFVSSQGLNANKEIILKAWQEGRTIVELMPVNALHSNFWHSVGCVSYLDPEQAGNDLMLLALNGMACYQLQNPLDKSNFVSNEIDDEDMSPDSEPSERSEDNFDVVPVAIGETSEYISTKLNSLVEWCSSHTSKAFGVDTSVPEFDGDLSGRILDQQYSQEITKTLNVGADNFKICKVALSDADRVTRHSTIDFCMHVTPVYSYELNGADKSGDYYFITMSMISHNQPLYGLYKKWHGAVRTWAHIFYSRKIKWTATLLDSGKNTLGSRISFYATPKPESTASGATYTNGFSAGLNVSGQGGINAGKPTGLITVGGSFTWSNSESRTVQDQSVEMSTGTSDRSVHYEYITNNIKEEDSTEDAVPAIARTDQKCEASWCWRVTGVSDDDNATKFILKLNSEPIYGYMWRHATWTCEGEKKETCLLGSDLRTLYFEINNPDRSRNGVLELKSTNSNYMTNIQIMDASGNVVAESTKALERNLTQRFQLPVGEYDIEYEILDGDTAELKGKYRIPDVLIETAETTVKSTLDGKKIS